MKFAGKKDGTGNNHPETWPGLATFGANAMGVTNYFLIGFKA